jgi:hypothetical protein
MTPGRHELGHAAGLRRLQPAEHVDLPGGPAWPGGLRVRHQEGSASRADATDLRASLDTLHVLASNTDGRAIVNRNDLACRACSRSCATRAPTTCWATTRRRRRPTASSTRSRSTSSGAAWTSARGRATGPTRRRKRRGGERAAQAGGAVGRPRRARGPGIEPPGGRSTRYWVGAARGDGGESRMTFVWEAIAPPAGGRRTETAAARVADGVSERRAAVPRSHPRGREQPRPPPRGAASFDAPPGPLQLRIVFEGPTGRGARFGGRGDHRPRLHQVEVSFATPRVYRARTARDVQVLKGQPDAIPTSDREFSRTERLLVRTEAYAPGGVTPEVTARLLNRAGDRMADVPVQQTPGRRARDRAPALGAGGRGIPHRVEREEPRRQHRAGTHRLQGGALTLTPYPYAYMPRSFVTVATRPIATT